MQGGTPGMLRGAAGQVERVGLPSGRGVESCIRHFSAESFISVNRPAFPAATYLDAQDG